MMTEGPIGRRQVFEEIVGLLDSRGRGLITVAGPPGSGRSTLLRHVCVAARTRGWQVIGGDSDPAGIEASTSMVDVRRRLAALIEDDSSPTTSSAREAIEAGQRSVARLIDWITRRVDEDQQVLELVERVTPLLVAIDGYRPNPVFGSWFRRRLIARAASEQTKLVFVIADRAENLKSLQSAAELSIELGPLDADEVRHHFAQQVVRLRPPVDGPEMERYVSEAVAHPSFFDALSAIFEAIGVDPQLELEAVG